jgi:hypothetical protein
MLQLLLQGITAISLAMLGHALAQRGDVELGQGVVCNTQTQMERFVAMDVKIEAVAVINTDEPHACGMVTASFIRGRTVHQVRNSLGTYDVVEVLVVAVHLDGDWGKALPAIQYTLFLVTEENT